MMFGHVALKIGSQRKHPVVYPVKAGEDLENCRLAASGRADKGDKITLMDVHADVGNGEMTIRFGAKNLAQIGKANNRSGRRRGQSARRRIARRSVSVHNEASQLYFRV